MFFDLIFELTPNYLQMTNSAENILHKALHTQTAWSELTHLEELPAIM